MVIKKDKYANNGFDSNFATNANIIDAKKIEYANCDCSIGTANIDKNKDIGNGFDDVIASEIDRNVKKHLKMTNLKILVAIINCKRIYLLKKNLGYKTFLDLFYNFLILLNWKNYDFNFIIYDLIINLD